MKDRYDYEEAAAVVNERRRTCTLRMIASDEELCQDAVSEFVSDGQMCEKFIRDFAAIMYAKLNGRRMVLDVDVEVAEATLFAAMLEHDAQFHYKEVTAEELQEAEEAEEGDRRRDQKRDEQMTGETR